MTLLIDFIDETNELTDEQMLEIERVIEFCSK